MQKKMAATFRAQGRAVLRDFVRFKRHFAEAALGASIESMIEGALKVTIPTMTKDFSATGLAGYEWGYADLASNLGMQDAFSLAHPDAVKWANKNAAMRVSNVNKTTKKGIRNLISYGLDNGESYGEVARSIKRQFTQFAVGSPLEHIQSRAELVAVTEMGEAYEAGAATLSDELEAHGIEQEKSRVGPNDGHTSDACIADLAAGWIPKSQAFPSGIMSGLEHPGCRHGTIYRVSRAGEEPEAVPSIVAKAKATKKAAKGIPNIPKIPKAAKATKTPVKPTATAQKEWVKGLSTSETDAIGYWQKEGYTMIRKLESGREIPSAAMPAVKRQATNLYSALDKAPQYKGTVYRGLKNLDDDVANALIKGETVTFDALSSATRERQIGNIFAERSSKGQSIIMEIRTKTGVEINGASVGSYLSEKEVILRKGTQYRVVESRSLGLTEFDRPLTKLILEEL